MRFLSFAFLRKHIDVWCREDVLFDDIYRCAEEREEDLMLSCECCAIDVA